MFVLGEVLFTGLLALLAVVLHEEVVLLFGVGDVLGLLERQLLDLLLVTQDGRVDLVYGSQEGSLVLDVLSLQVEGMLGVFELAQFHLVPYQDLFGQQFGNFHFLLEVFESLEVLFLTIKSAY